MVFKNSEGISPGIKKIKPIVVKRKMLSKGKSTVSEGK
jgi:hypothetical protein